MATEPGDAVPDGLDGELVVEGRITTASNATFLAAVGDTAVVYKPVAGEQPLWDFPDGRLADREVAAFELSEVLGWNVVPRTWLRDGPYGEGMVQLWQDIDEDQDPVDLLPVGDVPDEGWLQVLEGEDERDRPVALVHEDTDVLRRMAVFDVLANNADRKGAHVLAMEDGHRFGVDHGLTFHTDHKLRTVLWGWVGSPLSPQELAGVDRVRTALEGELAETLAPLLTDIEILALMERAEVLYADARFPRPRGRMPAVPWPLF